jgi:hypothetical protein
MGGYNAIGLKTGVTWAHTVHGMKVPALAPNHPSLIWIATRSWSSPSCCSYRETASRLGVNSPPNRGKTA